MSWELKKGNVFYGGEEIIRQFATAGIDGDFIPPSGGPSSVPEIISSFAPNVKLAEIPPDFSLEYLRTLENLAAYNADISYAVDNVVQLANTDHDITFSDSVSPTLIAKMKAHLIRVQNGWYQNSGGIRSMKADLLTQTVINGALSAEHYPKQNLSGIDQVVRIAPKNIRFVYDTTTSRYVPYQTSSIGISVKVDITGMVRLNTNTYKYIAIRRFFESPYATPPFISAIDGLLTQKDMLTNFKEIMKKLGMLGFLSAEVSAPPQRPGESQEAYWQRSLNYLNDVVYPQLQKNLGKGMVAGFAGKHKFTLNGNTMNTQGAADLFKLVQSRIFAGVKQDPNMLGENYAVTETFGRVILAKMLSQISDYQNVVDQFIAGLYLMELRLAGFKVDFIEVKSQTPLVGDKLKEQQAEAAKIANANTKRDNGYISQEQAANELGYEEPYADGPIVPTTGAPADPAGDGLTPTGNKTDPSNDPKASDSNLKTKQVEYRLRKHTPRYDYCETHQCNGVNRHNFLVYDNNFKGTDLGKYTSKYFNEMFDKYQDATKKITDKIGAKLLSYPKTTPLETIQRETYLYLISYWESDFVVPMQDVVKDNITVAWDKFRKDKRIFDGKNPKGYAKSKFTGGEYPEGVLDLDDFKAIQFMENCDSLYLGKFITDPDTVKKVNGYLKENYLNDYLPIGNDTGALNKFSKTFSETLDLEAWKIRRIIDTTMNKVRNYSQIYYMSQAAVDEFEIIEMNDNLTCDYCASMDGKIFTVATAKQKIEKEVDGGPENLDSTSPFITKESISDIQNKSASDLQSSGYDCPPFHPHCRGTVGAHFG